MGPVWAGNVPMDRAMWVGGSTTSSPQLRSLGAHTIVTSYKYTDTQNTSPDTQHTSPDTQNTCPDIQNTHFRVCMVT